MPPRGAPSDLIDSTTVAASITYYRAELANTNSATFVYLPDIQKNALKKRLITTLLLLRLEAEEHFARGRTTALHKVVGELNDTLELLRQLRLAGDSSLWAQVAGEPRPERLAFVPFLVRLDLEKSARDDGHPTETEFEEEVKTFTTAIRDYEEAKKLDYKENQTHVDTIKYYLARFNNARRDWWVWGGMTAGAMFDLMAHPSINQSLPYQSGVLTVMDNIAPTLGATSWLLYILRSSLDIGESVREAFTNHTRTIPSPVKLKKETSLARLGKNLFNRKFILLNDILWGAANTLCYFYLNGAFSTTLGRGGYIISLVLLVADVLLTAWRFREQYNNHTAYIEKLKFEAERINGAYVSHGNKEWDSMPAADRARIVNNCTYNDETNPFFFELQQNKKAMAKAQFDWLYQKRKLSVELSYTVSLVASYGAVCGFFAFGGLNLLIMGVVGASLLFVTTVIFNFTNTAIDRQKFMHSMANHTAEADEFIVRFNSGQVTEEEKKLCYLQAKSSLARADFDKEMAQYQLRCLPLNTLVDVLTPVVVFLSFSFLTLSMGLLATACCIVVVLALKHLMKSWEPKLSEYQGRFFPKLEEGGALETEFTRLKGLEKISLDDFYRPLSPASSPTRSDDGKQTLLPSSAK